ncbi:MAG: EamA family transporter [Cyanobacteria bacterium]|nr:EamA family transporter [Cyanobacteria bacterium CG_2015-16_32_12]NCO79108.1 EamA family transporter [Cyanobacteria bacterium CG_2015-22_32_23]NCQ03685.1 EamA family transporter [Cyanobacteria bacterium CG_2015-09_32_10]NCQ41865.1 EamA family transporter [Cyanobacteria bacterium CG_2015-04_32_10]NCS84187.1 EamA family transporter [Cyanobacteria bacterium CG_2015-02_32_10]
MLNSLILLVLVITQVLGDVCLSHAMKIYGEITSFSPSVILNVIYYLFTSPWFYLGLGSLTFSWFLYLFSVSKMDLSYVLPIHASSYILNALFAWLFLQETITPIRWSATAIISGGVFIVGYSQYQYEKYEEKLRDTLIVDKENASKILVTLPFGAFLPVTWLGVILMVLADSMGDLLNAKAMKTIGDITSFSFLGIFQWLKKILTNTNIIIGVSCQAIALLLLICLLSWDDLSLIRPASAISYLITLISAKYILHEKIHRGRFIGICWILFGVITLSV